MCGMMPSTRTPRYDSTSSIVPMEVSSVSCTKASTSPSMRPRSPPTSMVLNVSGPVGAVGSAAGRTIETSSMPSDSLMSASW